jgi:hypothetical protein
MTTPAPGPLPTLVARLQERIKELRRAGNLADLLTTASAAADEIEQRVGESRTDAERQALLTAKRFTYNAAADCWPGWNEKSPDADILLAALALAQRSARLVKTLDLGPLQEGTGTWLCGAFELALGRYADAAGAFTTARQHYIAAKAPGLVLLTEGYAAIVREIAGDQVPAGGEGLDQITARIAAGGFEDGAEWVEQLRTALKVFAQGA